MGEKEKIKFYNVVFEYFINPENPLGKSFIKLDKCITGKSAFDYGVFQKKIIKSPEFQEYSERRKEIIDKYIDEKTNEYSLTLSGTEEENKKKIEEFKRTIFISSTDLKEWSDLLSIDSGLELDKCTIYGRDILYNFDNEIYKKEKRCVITNTDINLTREDFSLLESFCQFEW
jgi:hypothetical protein